MIYIFFYACAVLVTAIVLEFYKKVCRGYKDDKGNPKTKATKMEIYIVAFVFSLLWGAGLNYISFNKGLFVILLWTLAVYSVQYYIDTCLIKKTVNGLLKRIGG